MTCQRVWRAGDLKPKPRSRSPDRGKRGGGGASDPLIARQQEWVECDDSHVRVGAHHPQVRINWPCAVRRRRLCLTRSNRCLPRGALLQEEEFRRSGGRAVLLFYERIGTWTDTAV